MTTPDPLPSWRPFSEAPESVRGRSPQARWLQLATVAADGTPRVRTLLFRAGPGPRRWIYSPMVAVPSPPSCSAKQQWNCGDYCPCPLTVPPKRKPAVLAA
jgi:hypothetical protein